MGLCNDFVRQFGASEAPGGRLLTAQWAVRVRHGGDRVAVRWRPGGGQVAPRRRPGGAPEAPIGRPIVTQGE